MPRFFVASQQIENDCVRITGEDAHHLSYSLRAGKGDRVTICDGAGNDYICQLTDFLPDEVRARVLEKRENQTEPPLFITLYQALPKGDKLETIIQKAVECGVSRIVPFESARCVARSKGENEEKKRARRARIAAEAAGQCERGILPAVEKTISFSEMLTDAAKNDLVLFCYEGEGTKSLGELLPPPDTAKTLAVVIGSEGGFEKSEAEAAKERGASLTGLGKRILRTETAPIFALSAISFATELRQMTNK